MPKTETKSVDPAVREKLDQLCAHILSFTGDDELEHYNVGKDIAQISDEQLFKPVGYKSISQFIKNELTGQSKSQLMLYASVARAFGEPTVRNYGMTRLGKLISLVNVLGFDRIPDPPDDFTIPFEDKDGQSVTKRFAECAAAEVQRAIRTAKGTYTGLPTEVTDRLQRAQAAIEAALGEDTPVTIKATVRDGNVSFNVSNIPGDNLDEVGEVLKTA